MIVCGFLVPRNSIPPGWIWVHYISFVTYPLRALAVNEYEGLKFVCKSQEMIPAQTPENLLPPPLGFGNATVN